ncbi:MAG: FxLYD domain-containing protein [Halobacteria archaeon]|nr:FxLYD domain-containing protein [Halobacteria archaeon]
MDADLFVEAREAFVEGKVKNISNERLEEVSVDVVFYKDRRKSVHLDTWSASTRKLASGKIWMFRVYYQGPNGITPEGFEIILND